MTATPRPAPTAAPPAAPQGRAPGDRIHLADFWRGVAILAIFVNHLPPSPLQAWTTKPHGFSDTAAWFFLISGFVARLVYGRLAEQRGLGVASLRIAKRMGQLYLCNLLLAALYILAALYLSGTGEPLPWWADRPAFQLAAHAPLAAAGAAATLALNGLGTDILPTYVVVLGLFVLTLQAERRFRVPPLALALILYLASRGLGPWLFTGWTFNPLSWQLLFHLGGWLHDHRARLVSGPGRTTLVLVATWGMLLFCAFVRHADTLLPMPWAYWVGLLQPERGKAMLEWPYLAHSLLTLFAFGLILRNATIPRFAALRFLSSLGRKPLPLFTITTGVCYAAYCVQGPTLSAPGALVDLAIGGLLCLGYNRVSNWRPAPTAAPDRFQTTR